AHHPAVVAARGRRRRRGLLRARPGLDRRRARRAGRRPRPARAAGRRRAGARPDLHLGALRAGPPGRARAGGAVSAPLRVVTVTYSPGDSLADFLDSLEAATGRPYEVVMADNGSTDGVPEAAAAQGRARLHATGGNLGYGAAANEGAAGAHGEWL